ncbi:MAG: helix-turn-helix domain-containing protein [Bosea sp.]|uniref:helix-turn-helix domain-containing protein n=1 Tax=Bosea sp. (in: a-proteobacteria) TaxID=1871050 RepID=UPI001AC73B50|nr:helix-turn-helix domain-containing protein [Bosea sp. (in: a-proteobacteria)]MBN9454290.1 helix-turn-helix domain-containing protein [Bosea sp. (in: a-proteobacteria)]
MHQRTESPTKPLAYSPQEAARAAATGVNTIYQELNAGRLSARKLGRRTLILAADLEAWLRSLPTMKEAA